MIHLDIQNNNFRRKDGDLNLGSLYNLNLFQDSSNKGESSLNKLNMRNEKIYQHKNDLNLHMNQWDK